LALIVFWILLLLISQPSSNIYHQNFGIKLANFVVGNQGLFGYAKWLISFCGFVGLFLLPLGVYYTSGIINQTASQNYILGSFLHIFFGCFVGFFVYGLVSRIVTSGFLENLKSVKNRSIKNENQFEYWDL
jgi:hypothetical protein